MADDCAVIRPKKSERKRVRERQRRSDLSNAFDELSSVLSQIDPNDSDYVPNRRTRRRSVITEADGDVDASGMTRVDLIERTAAVLIKLQHENNYLKQTLAEQHRSWDGNSVLVMVPTLAPADPGFSAPLGQPLYPAYKEYSPLPNSSLTDYQHDFHYGMIHPHYQPYDATYPGDRVHGRFGHPGPNLHHSSSMVGPEIHQQLPPSPPGHYMQGHQQPSTHSIPFSSYPNSPQHTHSHQYDSTNVNLNSNHSREL